MNDDTFIPAKFLSFENGIDFWSPSSKKNVLEIGPLDGVYTGHIQNYHPLSHTIIDCNKDVCDEIADQFKEKIIAIHADAEVEITKLNKKFDIVYVLGVLYHLSSPLYLLEQIVNICNPDEIILDVIGDGAANSLNVNNLVDMECLNKRGNRYQVGRKLSGISLCLNNYVYEVAMKNLGYIKTSVLSYTQCKTIYKFTKA